MDTPVNHSEEPVRVSPMMSYEPSMELLCALPPMHSLWIPCVACVDPYELCFGCLGKPESLGNLVAALGFRGGFRVQVHIMFGFRV